MAILQPPHSVDTCAGNVTIERGSDSASARRHRRRDSRRSCGVGDRVYGSRVEVCHRPDQSANGGFQDTFRKITPKYNKAQR